MLMPMIIVDPVWAVMVERCEEVREEVLEANDICTAVTNSTTTSNQQNKEEQKLRACTSDCKNRQYMYSVA